MRTAVLRYCSKLAERNIGQHRNKDIEWWQELRKDLNKISILLAADSNSAVAADNNRVPVVALVDIAEDMAADKAAADILAGRNKIDSSLALPYPVKAPRHHHHYLYYPHKLLPWLKSTLHKNILLRF